MLLRLPYLALTSVFALIRLLPIRCWPRLPAGAAGCWRPYTGCGCSSPTAARSSGPEAAMRSWDDSRTVRAWVLRNILRGRLAPDPDPDSMRLRGPRIAGRVDRLDADCQWEASPN